MCYAHHSRKWANSCEIHADYGFPRGKIFVQLERIDRGDPGLRRKTVEHQVDIHLSKITRHQASLLFSEEVNVAVRPTSLQLGFGDVFPNVGSSTDKYEMIIRPLFGEGRDESEIDLWM